MTDLAQQIQFIFEIDKLKLIVRKSRLFHSQRHENDAEHSWHLAMMALVLAKHADEPLDMLKVLKMLLIHDLVEIDAGDVFVFDTAARLQNTDVEVQAARRIFGLLPAEQGEELYGLWEEFEAGETAEARFANAMDRLEPVLQNVSNQGGSWTEFGIEAERVIEKNKKIAAGSAVLWGFAEDLIHKHFGG